MTNEERYLKDIVEQLKKLNTNISKMTGIHTTQYRLYKKLHLMDKNCFSCRYFDPEFSICRENMQAEIVRDPSTPCMNWAPKEGIHTEEDDQNDDN